MAVVRVVPRETMAMSRRIVTVVALVVTASTATVAYYRSRQAEKAPTPTVSQVTRGDVFAKVDATGTLAPVTTVEVGSQVSGSIKTLKADFNSRVRKGEVIAELEPSIFQAQVDQARATTSRLDADADRARVQVDDTRRKLVRAQELFSQQLLAATDLETAQANAKQAEASLKSAEAEVVQARAALNQAEVNLSHTIIRAPIEVAHLQSALDVSEVVHHQS